MNPVQGPQQQPNINAIQGHAAQPDQAAQAPNAPLAAHMDGAIAPRDRSDSVASRAQQFVAKIGQFLSENPKVVTGIGIALLVTGVAMVAAFVLKQPPEGESKPVGLLLGGFSVLGVGTAVMAKIPNAPQRDNQDVQQEDEGDDQVARQQVDEEYEGPVTLGEEIEMERTLSNVANLTNETLAEELEHFYRGE